MEIDKSNKILWDTDVSNHPLYEKAFMLHIKRIKKLNEELYNYGEDKRASYMRLSDFIHHINTNPKPFKKELDDAKILLRKDKIRKITNG
jgi:hypothetical protein